MVSYSGGAVKCFLLFSAANKSDVGNVTDSNRLGLGMRGDIAFLGAVRHYATG